VVFWQKALEAVDLITVGLRSHFVAALSCRPVVDRERPRPDRANRPLWRSCLLPRARLWCAKAGADKMAADMAKETTAVQCRGCLNLDGRTRYRTGARLSR